MRSLALLVALSALVACSENDSDDPASAPAGGPGQPGGKGGAAGKGGSAGKGGQAGEVGQGGTVGGAGTPGGGGQGGAGGSLQAGAAGVAGAAGAAGTAGSGAGGAGQGGAGGAGEGGAAGGAPAGSGGAGSAGASAGGGSAGEAGASVAGASGAGAGGGSAGAGGGGQGGAGVGGSAGGGGAGQVEFAAPQAVNERVGLYHWGIDYSAYPGQPSKLAWGNGLVAALGSRTLRITLGPSDPYEVLGGAGGALVAMAQSPGYAAALADPAFSTVLITTYSAADQVSQWFDGYSAQEAAAEQAEVEALALHLGATYPQKRFVLLNWEADSALAGLDLSVYPSYIGWIQSRVDGVRSARAKGVSNVFGGLEISRVRRDGVYCDEAHPCALSAVLPAVDVDVVSYSSWDSLGVDTATADVGKRLGDDLQEILSVFKQRDPSATMARVIVGELGSARDVPVWGECEAAVRVSSAIGAALDAGVSYTIFWQVGDHYPAEPTTFLNYGAYKPDGSLSLTGKTIQKLLTTGDGSPPLPADCPVIGQGGVVEALTSSPTICAKSIVSIYGQHFSASGNVVHVQQGSAVALIQAGSKDFYESSGQINATLAPGVVAGKKAVVYVRRADGVESNGQLVDIQPDGACP